MHTTQFKVQNLELLTHYIVVLIFISVVLNFISEVYNDLLYPGWISPTVLILPYFAILFLFAIDLLK